MGSTVIEFAHIKRKAKSLDMIGKITTSANTYEYSFSNTISIGIVILAKDLPKSHRFYDENLIYIWEAVASGGQSFGDGVSNVCGSRQTTTIGEACCLPPMGPEIIEHDPSYGFNGVQLRDLDKILENSVKVGEFFSEIGCQEKNYELFWASLSKNDHPLTRPQGKLDKHEFGEALAEMIETYNGRPYDKSFCCVNLLASIFSCFRSCRYAVNFGDHQNQLFCSELAAMIYRDFGILNSSVRPENVVPMDFFGFDKDGEVVMEWDEVRRFE